MITVRLPRGIHVAFQRLAHRAETSMNKLAVRLFTDAVMQDEDLAATARRVEAEDEMQQAAAADDPAV
jgi:hypothetical protein